MSHNHSASFEQFVLDCKTLYAVDELIRLSTNGARSIHTVTVLDAYSYKPKNGDIPDERCHQLLAQMLKAKKPKVVIRCHIDGYCDSWMGGVELPAVDYKFVQRKVEIDENHTAVVIQSFHPSIAVNNADYRPEFRALLMYHFIAAFAELSRPFRFPDSAEEIRKLCSKKGGKSGPKLEVWQAAVRISKALELRYGDHEESYQIGFVDEREPDFLRRKAKNLDDMYHWLGHLSGTSRTFGALGIARIALFLWKRYFHADPLYEQVKLLSFLRGSQQEGWFPAADHIKFDAKEVSLEERLFQLQLADADSAIPRTSAGKYVDLNVIHELNIEANKLASAALSAFSSEEEAPKDNQTDAMDSSIPFDLAQLVEHRIRLINDCLHYSSITELDGCLRI
ncbi:hypothetical protein H2201_009270, partial [Coniosporium apollinis]